MLSRLGMLSKFQHLGKCVIDVNYRTQESMGPETAVACEQQHLVDSCEHAAATPGCKPGSNNHPERLRKSLRVMNGVQAGSTWKVSTAVYQD